MIVARSMACNNKVSLIVRYHSCWSVLLVSRKWKENIKKEAWTECFKFWTHFGNFQSLFPINSKAEYIHYDLPCTISLPAYLPPSLSICFPPFLFLFRFLSFSPFLNLCLSPSLPLFSHFKIYLSLSLLLNLSLSLTHSLSPSLTPLPSIFTI